MDIISHQVVTNGISSKHMATSSQNGNGVKLNGKDCAHSNGVIKNGNETAHSGKEHNTKFKAD